MKKPFQTIPYTQFPFLSRLVKDYYQGQLDPSLYQFSPNWEGLGKAIEQRQHNPVDRLTLVQVLEDQYKSLEVDKAVNSSIEALKSESTFTICTAHQPNLLGGYLYFIYKIAHAIKLAQSLSERFPNKSFVPVYYMGAEDNDLEELGTFNYDGQSFKWDGDGQKGAVGRMYARGMSDLWKELYRYLGPPNHHTDALKAWIDYAYQPKHTIAQATRFLVNALFGQYGLVIIDGDDRRFKRQMIDVFKDDLTRHSAFNILPQSIENWHDKGYKVQVTPRPINLFYLQDQYRERIECVNGETFYTVDGRYQWTKEAMMQELNDLPESFSPNVILRALLQETILPNIAFIGGGAEVAYWLEMKATFDHYERFYPTILLRQSMYFQNLSSQALQEKLQLNDTELLWKAPALVDKFITQFKPNFSQLTDKLSQVEVILESMTSDVAKMDVTLVPSVKSIVAKVHHAQVRLSQKLNRVIKEQEQTTFSLVHKLNEQVYPNAIPQERVQNFMTYYTVYGSDWIRDIIDATQELGDVFVILKEKNVADE